MKFIAALLSPGRAWLAIFATWSLFLSGALASFTQSPGVFQAIQLQSLLQSKKKQAEDLQDQLLRLQAEAADLEKSRPIQHREIRRVLGYAAEDEIIFDFAAPERL